MYIRWYNDTFCLKRLLWIALNYVSLWRTRKLFFVISLWAPPCRPHVHLVPCQYVKHWLEKHVFSNPFFFFILSHSFISHLQSSMILILTSFLKYDWSLFCKKLSQRTHTYTRSNRNILVNPQNLLRLSSVEQTRTYAGREIHTKILIVRYTTSSSQSS